MMEGYVQVDGRVQMFRWGWVGTDVSVGMGGLAGLAGSSGKGVSCWLGVIKVVQVAVEKGFINGSLWHMPQQFTDGGSHGSAKKTPTR